MSKSDLPKPSKAPCGSCPYRKDVPSGLWSKEEYEKLPQYDGETFEQIMQGGTALFYCHQNDGSLCAGWVGCHDMHHAAAIRFARGEVDDSVYDYISPVPLFGSGTQAALYGMRDIENPGPEARVLIDKLERKLKGRDK